MRVALNELTLIAGGCMWTATHSILGGFALLAMCTCGPPEHPLVDTLPAPQPSHSSSSPNAPPSATVLVPSWLKFGVEVTHTVARDDSFLQGTNIPSSWWSDIAAQYSVHFYLPRSASSPGDVRLLMVFGAGGTNVEALPDYESLAEDRKLLTIAVDGYQSTANSDGRSHEYYYCALKVRDELQQEGTLSTDDAFFLAGFSGGAKMAMSIGPYGGTDTFRGVVAAGCNEDLASYGLGMLSTPSSLALPFVVVNATDDGVVGGATPTVIASMMQSGFTHVSSLRYSGGHVIPPVAVLQQAVDLILILATK